MLTGFERPAVSERIPGHVSWARADRCQTTEVAVSVDSTGVDARVDTSVVDTCRLIAWALTIRFALGGADPVGISMVTLRNNTDIFYHESFVKV